MRGEGGEGSEETSSRGAAPQGAAPRSAPGGDAAAKAADALKAAGAAIAETAGIAAAKAGAAARRGWRLSRAAAGTLGAETARLSEKGAEAARVWAGRAAVRASRAGTVGRAALARAGRSASIAAAEAGAVAARAGGEAASALRRRLSAPAPETLPAPVESGFGQVEAMLEPILRGAAGDAPLQLLRAFDQAVVLRATLTVWSRLDMSVEQLPGERPEGLLAADSEAAAAALTPEARAALDRGRGAASLRRRLERDPWSALDALQGQEPGPALTERRSVLLDCPDCAGAGGFPCATCDGAGRCACPRCQGEGMVDAVCPSCRGAVHPAESGRVALDPDAAAILVQNQAATGGEVSDELRAAADGAARREGCPNCGGRGAARQQCAYCAGAGVRRCPDCEGAGRSLCARCAGTGRITHLHQGRVRYERSLHLALEPERRIARRGPENAAESGAPSESRAVVAAAEAEEPAEIPAAALEALRAGWPALAAGRALDFRMTGFQNNGFACQAVFEARTPLAGMVALVGRGERRLRLDFWAAGAPLTLLDPPKALDQLHRWRVDEARLAGVEGRRGLLDALAGTACGRAALRAAARRERRLPEGAFGPLASDDEAARMLRLAKGAHQAAGWRSERWVWAAAALLAAPLGWWAGRGLGGEEAGAAARNVAAAADGAAAGAAGGAVSFWAQTAALTAPFLALWLTAGLVAAIVYHRETRRLLGFARPRSLTRLFFGAAPATALALGGAAYLAALGVSPAALLPKAAAPDPALTRAAAAAAPTEATTVMASVASESDAAAAQKAAEAAREAEREAEAVRAFYDNAKPDRWRERRGIALIRSTDGAALLAARCVEGRPLLRLSSDFGDMFAEHVAPSLVWRTENTALTSQDLGLEYDDEGRPAALFWNAPPAALAALRQDGRLRVFWSNGPNRLDRREFALRGSSLALGAVMAQCGD